MSGGNLVCQSLVQLPQFVADLLEIMGAQDRANHDQANGNGPDHFCCTHFGLPRLACDYGEERKSEDRHGYYGFLHAGIIPKIGGRKSVEKIYKYPLAVSSHLVI